MVYRKKQWRNINKQRISRLFRNHKKSSRIDKIRNLLRKGEQMKKEKEQKLYWRRLDNSAKIFPISAGKKYSTVFRLSVVLKENVNPRVLEKALQNALETYQSFKVRMKAGLFWYYLEHNPKDSIIEEEKEYPCQYINPKTNNNYLFKVTYFEKKINIDIFHSLTDGNSGTIFFKEIKI